MNKVDGLSYGFFPEDRIIEKNKSSSRLKKGDKRTLINSSSQKNNDTKVTIPNQIKEFSRIKKLVDATPKIDRAAIVKNIKERINNNTYKVDENALAERILAQEFNIRDINE